MTAQKTSLFNAFETQLSASIGAADLTFNVDATAPLTSPCYLVIDPTSASKREYVLFDGTFTSTAFVTTSTANRGLGGSAAGAQAHAAGTTVRCVPMHQHFGDLNDRVDLRLTETASNAAYFTRDSTQTLVDLSHASFGAVGDDATNDTAAIQAALDAAVGGTLLWPNSPGASWRIGALTIPSNIRIVIQPNTVIRAITGLADSVRLFNMDDKTDITIEASGATLEGVKAEYTAGEQRHGVMLRGASRVRIVGLAVNDTGGDGFYIGASPSVGGFAYSEDVTLVDVSANNNRRQGMSIVSARNLRVVRPRLTNTTGTAPQAGLDVEPNVAADYIENVAVIQPYTAGNSANGIVVALNSLDATSQPVSLLIDEHVSDTDASAGFATSIRLGAAAGLVKYRRGTIIDSPRAAISVRNWRQGDLWLEIDEPKIYNGATAGAGSPKYDSGISIFAESTDGGTDPMGSIVVRRPWIDSSGSMATYIHVDDGRGVGANEVFIDTPLAFSGIAADAKLSLVTDNTAHTIRYFDPYEVLTYDYNLSITLAGTAWRPFIHNASATANRTYTLSNTGPNDITFEQRSGTYSMAIAPPAGGAIYPAEFTQGGSITTAGAGARVRLIRRGVNWYVVESTGTNGRAITGSLSVTETLTLPVSFWVKDSNAANRIFFTNGSTTLFQAARTTSDLFLFRDSVGTSRLTVGADVSYLSTPIRPLAAATASRPSASTVGAGAHMFDTSLGKPIWSNGTGWVDATGTSV